MRLALGCAFLNLGCLAVADVGTSLALDHIRNTPRTPTITFVNDLPTAVCSINMWRDAGPATDRDANWLELTDVRRLEPGASVTVGIVPRDAVYHLHAVDCDGAVRARAEVTPSPGHALRLGARTPPPPAQPPASDQPPQL
ncbi:MAG: hypothetical protein JNJ54_08710 [Myxococcaceae bacterium]|nr:hypothetical protein [Myxococcaceae bacterium]